MHRLPCIFNDIRTLQSWMGHRDIKSIMIYLKGVQSKAALAKVNAGALAR
jgi:integrase/recombinase XerD